MKCSYNVQEEGEKIDVIVINNDTVTSLTSGLELDDDETTMTGNGEFLLVKQGQHVVLKNMRSVKGGLKRGAPDA